MSAITYYTASGQSAFNAVTTIGMPVWEVPFEELTDRLVFRQQFMQTAASYSPMAPNTTYTGHGQNGVPTSTSYVLVSETDFEDYGAGLFKWTRTFAAVPSVRYDYTSIAYNYPAVLTIPVVSGAYTNFTTSGYAGVDRLYIGTDGSVSFSRGDMAAISYRVSISGTTVQMTNFVDVRDIGNAGGIIVDLPPNMYDPSITITRQIARVTKTTGRNESKTLVGRAVIEYNYALIAPNITPVFTFSSRQNFTLDGHDVDYVDQKTLPTIGTYAGWVASGAYFNAEDDTWTRWLGNIYERKTVKVVAL